MTKPEPTQEEMDRATSLRQIPAELITDQDRNEYIRRTLAGEEVRAYSSRPGVWHVYDTDTPVIQAPPAQQWQVATLDIDDAGNWVVGVTRGEEHRRFSIHIALHPIRDAQGGYASDGYQARAGRVLLNLLNACAVQGEDPTCLDGGAV